VAGGRGCQDLSKVTASISVDGEHQSLSIDAGQVWGWKDVLMHQMHHQFEFDYDIGHRSAAGRWLVLKFIYGQSGSTII